MPNFLLKESSSIIAKTDYYYRYSKILDEMILYRSRIIKYLQEKDAFGIKFFNNSEPIELDDIPEFALPKQKIISFELIMLYLLNLALTFFFYYSSKKINLIKQL